MCSPDCCEIVPLILVIILMFWSYYVVIIEICVLNLNSEIARGVHITSITVLFVMMFWCFSAASGATLGTTPLAFAVSKDVQRSLKMAQHEDQVDGILRGVCFEKHIRLWTRTSSGIIRYCYRCKRIKPDRAHHCKACDKCVLKMYNHCWWMNSCIHFNNYKMFLLFVFYNFFYCLYFFVISIFDVIIFFREKEKDWFDLQIVIGCIISGIILILMLSLTIYHLKLVFRNETTLEDMGDTYFIYNEPLTFNISPCYNWKEVFGERICLWWIPIFTGLGNGTEFYTTFE